MSNPTTNRSLTAAEVCVQFPLAWRLLPDSVGIHQHAKFVLCGSILTLSYDHCEYVWKPAKMSHSGAWFITKHWAKFMNTFNGPK